MKTQTRKYLFCTLIILMAVFDTITFLLSTTKAFEINPIYLFTGSLIITIIIKIIALVTLCALIIKYKKSETIQFMLTLAGLYLIIGQLLGGISNINTHYEQPLESQVMETQQAVQTYSYITLVLFYFPMIISIITFMLWRWMFQERREKNE
mgnify:CR=1 FL=1